MERYLTEKARPGKKALWLENAALVLLFMLAAMLVYAMCDAAVWVRTGDQLHEASLAQLPQELLEGLGEYPLLLLLLIPVVLLVLAMNPLAERIRSRMHAVRIVRALEEAKGEIPLDNLEAACGVSGASLWLERLTERGYLADVHIVEGHVCLGERAEEFKPAEKEIKPLFHDVEV